MSKEVYGKEAQQKLLDGAHKLYKAVGTTLGPVGRNVLIGTPYGQTVTHDGVTVARSIELKDDFERVGVELIKEASEKLNTVAGDGTTTVTVLTYHLLAEAMAEINSGAPAMKLSKEVQAELENVIKYLDSIRKPAEDLKTLERIATISAGDETIGKLVAETMHQAGVNATVDIVPATSLETTKEVVKGFQLEAGYASPQMINNERKQQADFNNPAIILFSHKLYSFREILPVLDKVAENGVNEAVIVAEDFKGDLIPNLVLNNTSGTFRTLAVKFSSEIESARHTLEDLAETTGAKIIDGALITKDSAVFSDFGKAKKVVSTGEKTTFIGTTGDIKDRVAAVTELYSNSEGDQRRILDKRLGNLVGGVAVINVGGQTTAEVDEKIYRVEDAVAATRAAMMKGILPGGGIALLRAADTIKDDTVGGKILRNSLRQPFYQLMTNSEVAEEEVEKVNEATSVNEGIDLKTGKFANLEKVGVFDPYIVTTEALKTAVSIAVVGMTTGAIVVEETEDE